MPRHIDFVFDGCSFLDGERMARFTFFHERRFRNRLWSLFFWSDDDMMMMMMYFVLAPKLCFSRTHTHTHTDVAVIYVCLMYRYVRSL